MLCIFLFCSFLKSFGFCLDSNIFYQKLFSVDMFLYEDNIKTVFFRGLKKLIICKSKQLLSVQEIPFMARTLASSLTKESLSFPSTIGGHLCIHSKSEKVCGTAFSVKKNCGKSAGPFWATLGHFGSFLGHFGPFWVIFGHFRSISWHFWTNLRKVQFLLRIRWGRGARF